MRHSMLQALVGRLARAAKKDRERKVREGRELERNRKREREIERKKERKREREREGEREREEGMGGKECQEKLYVRATGLALHKIN